MLTTEGFEYLRHLSTTEKLILLGALSLPVGILTALLASVGGW